MQATARSPTTRWCERCVRSRGYTARLFIENGQPDADHGRGKKKRAADVNAGRPHDHHAKWLNRESYSVLRNRLSLISGVQGVIDVGVDVCVDELDVPIGEQMPDYKAQPAKGAGPEAVFPVSFIGGLTKPH